MAGRPYGLWVHGNDDTAGAVRSVDKLAGGLGLRQVAETVQVTGAIGADVRERCHELGATVAVTLAR